jgi:hypothetical protein
MDDLVTLSHLVNVFLRILLLNFTISLYSILLYLLFTGDAINTWILRSKIYLAILVLVVIIRRLQRNALRKADCVRVCLSELSRLKHRPGSVTDLATISCS